MGQLNSRGYFQMQMILILEGRMEPVVHLPAQQTSLDKIPLSIRDKPRLNLTEHGVLQYLDDTMIHAPTEELLFEHTYNFLERMRIFGIFIKPKKCELWTREVTFLGWQVSARGVAVDPAKTKAISNMPIPTTAGELQQYIATMQWLKPKLPGYNKIIAPLQEILNAICQKAAFVPEIM